MVIGRLGSMEGRLPINAADHGQASVNLTATFGERTNRYTLASPIKTSLEAQRLRIRRSE